MSVPAHAPILITAAMRAAELAMTAQGTSLSELMERAGAAVADLVWRAAAGRAILILCGPGNNGGDGYVAARLLAARGAVVRVAASAAPATDLARAAAAGWAAPVEAIGADTAPAPVLVDALFGVGLARPLAPELVATLGRLAQAAERSIAVDVPSGVASDSGACLTPLPHFDITVALGALKPAHILLPAAAHCGAVQLADIGIAVDTSMTTLPRFFPQLPDADRHKYTRGQVLVIGGAMGGAGALTAAAALRAGAGYSLLHSEGAVPVQAVVRNALPLAERLRDRRIGAIIVGPGQEEGTALDQLTVQAVAAGKPLVLDAGAIKAALAPLAAAAMVCPPAILTPHSGEFDRAFGSGRGSKIDRTRAAAKKSGAVIIHKGADTIIAAPDGRVAAAWPGSPHLASAGTGDVLAGACGAMLAQGFAPFEAACRAVSWHMDRARSIGSGLIADDLVAHP
jgi:ADP-dependent NAD(P)H-hydrate dehydratase / NAD(P)H-hydrate epimerase